MEEINPQVLFGFGFETYLRKLKYESQNVDVLEIYQFEVCQILISQSLCPELSWNE